MESFLITKQYMNLYDVYSARQILFCRDMYFLYLYIDLHFQ